MQEVSHVFLNLKCRFYFNNAEDMDVHNHDTL